MRAHRRSARSARGRRRACPAPGPLRTATVRRRWRSLPSSSLDSALRAEKSSSLRASSTRRRWSPSSSDLRVTFSVARTVRSATSLRISWIARRVSASMSRRVCSSISSRASLDASLASRSWTSAALRARATISSAWWRASRQPLAVLGEQLVGLLLGALGRVDRVLDHPLALVERVGDPREREVAQQHHATRANTTSVQIIRPMPGLTRKLPPLSEDSAAVTVTVAMSRASVGPRGRRPAGRPRGRRTRTPP